MQTRLLIAPFLLLSLATASSAYAHIELQSPLPRYPLADTSGGANKACPCGAGESNRLCNVEGDRNDPDRAAAGRISALVSGDTLTLRFDEYVGHAGRYRVAIDYNGADLADFNANILVDIPDPAGSAGNAGGSIWSIDVPLPNFSCDNCTLQLIQMMDGNTTDPVPDPIGRSSYYTCVDIVLTGGDAYPPGQDNLSTTTPGDPDAGPAGTPDAAAGNPGSDAGEVGGGPVDGGCACQSSGTSGGLLLLLFAVGLWWRRPRRVRQS